MKVEEKILERFDLLIDFGRRVLSTKTYNEYGDDEVDQELAMNWLSSSENLIERVFGSNCVHLKKIENTIGSHSYLTYSPSVRVLGILKSAKDDYEYSMLIDLKTIIEAEIFDEFLEQAEHLLNSGYFQPAAVITGCVLEDTLRKMCIRYEIEMSERPKLDKMNADLSKCGVYNKLTQKQITAWADLRNKAAHGHWDDFNQDDVRMFIQGLRLFMLNNFD
ncbi:hypothetical protein J2T12_001042 [Paenibacillus anaericanus]|uniref:hypothetical protein n=1 Tax=Paenibacillus anaericanus TaxID=170367 RepID=UPI002780F7E4|nr:hypothetical protein [Paenibacillus anaericanus]MDQ0087636.1 hypothetical protein [Paenibacillus anaericanus]